MSYVRAGIVLSTLLLAISQPDQGVAEEIPQYSFELVRTAHVDYDWPPQVAYPVPGRGFESKRLNQDHLGMSVRITRLVSTKPSGRVGVFIETTRLSGKGRRSFTGDFSSTGGPGSGTARDRVLPAEPGLQPILRQSQ